MSSYAVLPFTGTAAPTISTFSQAAYGGGNFPAGTSLANSSGDITLSGANTTNKYGILLGPTTSAGVKMYLSAASVVQFTLADASANATLAGLAFRTTNDTSAPQFYASYATTTGMYISNTGPSLKLYANNIVGLSLNSAGQASNLLRATATKATSYNVLAADSNTIFEGTAAITFTLPTIATTLYGATYTFCATGAFIITVAPAGTDKIATKAAGVSYASNGTTGATFTVTAVSANQWHVTGSFGTWA